MRDALNVKGHVEQLAAAIRTGNPPADAALAWLDGIDDVLRNRLAAVGLIPRRQTLTLGELIAGYVDSRKDVKVSTGKVYGHTKRNLLDFFGAGKLIRDITETDAEAWRIHLLTTEKLSENTIRKRSSIARQFFKAPVKKKLIPENPFGTLATVVKPDPTRFHFVSQKDAAAILEKCDPQMRVVFALARFGGLRIPSELIGLRWIDVDCVAGSFLVHSPKTAHHVGGQSRVVPLFAKLRPILQDAHDVAPDGAEFIVPNCRSIAKNFRKGLTRAIKLAGLVPWQKLFVNCRSSLESELIRQHDLATVCRWLGHSPRVAVAHYAQTLDDDWQRATGMDNAHQVALQKAMQEPAESNGNQREVAISTAGESSEFPATSRQIPRVPDSEENSSGRYWTRTSDLHDVNVAL